MSDGQPASHSKYPAAGDASVVRRAFALFIDAIILFLAYMMISIPAWSLAPGWLAFPVSITETRVLGEETYDYFSLKQQLDSCRFAVTTRETPGEALTWRSSDREPLEPCAYLARFDYGLWFEVLILLFYAPLMESRRWHATVGKLALALQVQRKDGSEIGFARAFLRNLAEALCVLSFAVGYLMALFTTRRQALHDLLTGVDDANDAGVGDFAEIGRQPQALQLVRVIGAAQAVIGRFQLLVVGARRDTQDFVRVGGLVRARLRVQLRDLSDLALVQVDDRTVGQLQGQELAVVVQEIGNPLHMLHEKKPEEPPSVLEFHFGLDFDLRDFFVRLKHYSKPSLRI